MSLEKMSDFFNSRVDGYEDHMRNFVDGAADYYKKLAEIFPKEKNLSIVDLGIGTGLELEEIFKVNPTLKVTGIDVSPEMLRKLLEKFRDKTENINTVLGSYIEYDFGKWQFDGAVSVQTLHHFSHEKKIELYKNLFQGIKNGGFYIEVDYYAPDQAYEDFYYKENARLRKEQRINDDEIYHFDTPCTISNQISFFIKGGFRDVRLMYMNGNTGIFFMRK